MGVLWAFQTPTGMPLAKNNRTPEGVFLVTCFGSVTVCDFCDQFVLPDCFALGMMGRKIHLSVYTPQATCCHSRLLHVSLFPRTKPLQVWDFRPCCIPAAGLIHLTAQTFQQVLDAALTAFDSCNTECDLPMQRLTRIWISRLEEEEHPSAKTLLQRPCFCLSQTLPAGGDTFALAWEDLRLCVLSPQTGTGILTLSLQDMKPVCVSACSAVLRTFKGCLFELWVSPLLGSYYLAFLCKGRD